VGDPFRSHFLRSGQAWKRLESISVDVVIEPETGVIGAKLLFEKAEAVGAAF
jgi:hypothetical protein